MTLRPADLLGLAEGFPDPLLHVAALRYLLCVLALGWAAVVWRGRRAWWTAAGMAWVVVAVGFWVLSFGRAYGVLEDREITLRAARIAVVAEAGGQEGVLSGEALEATAWTELAARGVPRRALQMLPTFLPLLTLPLLGLLVHVLWRRREAAALAAVTWLAFATGELETVRGLGLAGGLWSRPELAVALPFLVALGLLLARLRAAERLWPLLAAGLAALAAAVPSSPTRPGTAETLLVLTLDQGPWLFLGVYGLLRRGDPAARSLAGAGLLLLLAQTVFASVDAFAGQALYRLGLLLGAVPVVADLCARAGAWLAERTRHGSEPAAMGAAALVALLVPGSFLAWWDPTRIDGVAGASVPGLTHAVYDVTTWIRDHTPATAVVLASEDYAPTVAVLSGRRLLRAPTLSEPADEWRRIRAQAAVLEGRDPQKYVARYGVTYVLIAPSEFAQHGLAKPEDLDRLAQLRLRYRHAEGFRVYEIVR
jgi:hypothetical protein